MKPNVYALDTDTLSLLLRGQEQITQRVEANAKEVWLPTIVLEEQFRGRLAFLASLDPKRKADSLNLPLAYDLLQRTFRQLEKFQFLPYTPEAEALFQSWPAAVKRIGTRDCRIAAAAIVHGFVVVTCNLSHFQTIPGVVLEDWSQ